MTKEQKIIRAKVGLLELAKQLGNVSQACKMLGYSRDSFYQFKELYDKGGDLALAEMSRRKPILANRTSPEIEAQIVALSLEQPAFGQIRVANEMRKRGLEYCLFKRPAQHASDLMRLMSWRISCCIAKLILVKPQALEVCLIPACEILAQAEDPSFQDPAPRPPLTTTITLAWTAPSFAAVKGIVHAPCAKPAMRPESRDALLTAIAKARGWVDDIGSAALHPSPGLRA